MNSGPANTPLEAQIRQLLARERELRRIAEEHREVQRDLADVLQALLDIPLPRDGAPIDTLHQQVVGNLAAQQDCRSRRVHGATPPFEEMSSQMDQRQQLTDVFASYEDCKGIFTTNQWQVLCLRFRDGLSVEDIGLRIRKGPSTIYQYLQKAKQRKTKHDEELRAEKFRLLRGRGP